jgi:hypothetical protein
VATMTGWTEPLGFPEGDQKYIRLRSGQAYGQDPAAIDEALRRHQEATGEANRASVGRSRRTS